jgi:hypothetical protein
MSAVVISNNTATLWQTLFAMSAVVASVATGFGWLNRKLAKKSDIQKLSDELADYKDGNTKENTRIIALIEEQKADTKRTETRLERHIDFGTHARVRPLPNPSDGFNDE